MKQKIDIIEHELIPQHVILPEEERKQVIEKYRVKKPSQLPFILHSDPVIQAIGAKPGDMVKIVRKSNTAKETVYYRLVVEG